MTSDGRTGRVVQLENWEEASPGAGHRQAYGFYCKYKAIKFSQWGSGIVSFWLLKDCLLCEES